MVDELDEYLDTFKLKYDSFCSAFAYEKDDEVYLEGLSEVPILIDNLEIGKRAIEEFFENYQNQLEKHKKHFYKEVLKYSNKELLWETVSFSGDWDGYCSSIQKAEYEILKEELEKRLKEIKFL